MRAPWVREVFFGSVTVLVCVGLYVLAGKYSYEELQALAEENTVLGVLLFGVIMLATTVVAPLTSLPLVPLLAPFFGPFVTGLAAFVGWTLGAFIAFFIGRRYGRPVVSRFVNVGAMERYEKYFAPETSVFLIVMLRMVLPVDVLSYALAMFTSVTFRVYAIGTMLGIVWFSFAFAYAGSAIATKDYALLGGVGLASLVLLYGAWRTIRRTMRKDRG